MYLTARLDRWRRSVAVRLSLWFALLFAVGFSTIFVVMYVLLGRQLESRDVETLRIRLQQYAEIYENAGLPAMRDRVIEDSAAPHIRSLFVRMLNPHGDLIWTRVPPDWIEQDPRRIAAPDGWGGWTVHRVYTVRVPSDQQRDLIVVSTVLPDGDLLQVGRGTDSRSSLLEPLRAVFIWIGGAVVLVGFAVGVIAARRATRPLQAVVETARRIISTGALDARVPIPSRNDDVAELVQYFNTVLDKNASLLRSMREALDNVAHDLRTPLTSMRGTAELALSRLGNETVTRDALVECVEQSDNVLRLLRALMEISEAEAGVLKLEKHDCDLSDLTESAVDLYSDVADMKHIKLRFVKEGAAPVFADPTRMRQAIANLIDNAVKYTPDGGSVDVLTGEREGKALFQVSDTGPGVPTAEQPRIWERLYRGDQSRSQSGLGLGLSVVRAIVQSHGGDVTVHNGVAGGAVFELTLPLRPVAAKSPAAVVV